MNEQESGATMTSGTGSGTVALERAPALQDAVPRRSRNTVWGRFRRHKLAMAGLATLVIFGLAFAAYVYRAPLAAEIPATAPALARYARLVDELRERIETLGERLPSEQVE